MATLNVRPCYDHTRLASVRLAPVDIHVRKVHKSTVYLQEYKFWRPVLSRGGLRSFLVLSKPRVFSLDFFFCNGQVFYKKETTVCSVNVLYLANASHPVHVVRRRRAAYRLLVQPPQTYLVLKTKLLCYRCTLTVQMCQDAVKNVPANIAAYI